MCKFFSCISDGNGKVLFFTLEDVVKVMASGNRPNYKFNSHTSIAHFNNISPTAEDAWNKWEYNPTTKELSVDTLQAKDDREAVKNSLIAFFYGKDIAFMQNLYNRNSGNCNSGDRNSGDWNSGNRNSGDWNSGDWNSGDWNSGDWNSGDRNSGNCNSGNWNSGDWNSGDWNSGNCNSGNCNSGDRNSGDRNSGDRNSGNCNSGQTLATFCSKETYLLFNKSCSIKDIEKAHGVISLIPFYLTEWVYSSNMTEEEKKQYPNYTVCDGFLRKYDYKKAWEIALSKTPKDTIAKIKKIKNFSSKVFLEITGQKI